MPADSAARQANLTYLKQKQNECQRLPTTVNGARITRHLRLRTVERKVQLAPIVDI